jgi:hypothetical protein
MPIGPSATNDRGPGYSQKERAAPKDRPTNLVRTQKRKRMPPDMTDSS